MSKSNGKYWYPVKAMSNIFRAKYVAILRHSGFLSSIWKRTKLCQLQIKLTGIERTKMVSVEVEKFKPSCPCCKTRQMITLLTFGRRGPPREFYKVANEKTTSLISI